jgi:hypothetical protein
MTHQCPTSPLFWICQCDANNVHFTDDDACVKCGRTEDNSPHADVESVRRAFPFIPLENIPVQTDSHSAVEDAFFAIRELIRKHT